MINNKRVLVCAPKMPEFDREGGSRRIFHLIELFRDSGWATSFLAQNGIDGGRYARVLQQLGVATYVSDHSWSGGEASKVEFAKLVEAGGFELIVIAFWNYAEQLLPIIRELSPGTKVVVDSIDLHFLRQSRMVFRSNNETDSTRELDAHYADEMRRELNIYAASDAVLTVSQKEASLINDFTGNGHLAYPIPDLEDLEVSPIPLAQRSGMLFVGNYRHPPNVEAVEYLCRRILPKVPSGLLKQHRTYIVGNELTRSIAATATGLTNVAMVGWVPSVLPYLNKVRISLIPLLYGAGTKRKLMQSMMVGTPSVSTTIGVEGLNLIDDRHVLIADNPDRFADSIVALLSDDQKWQSLAEHGREFIASVHSRRAVKEQFNRVIDSIVEEGVDSAELSVSQ